MRTLIGNIKGPKGDTGATGATGATGPGATVSVGTVTTLSPGSTATVTNSGTETDAVFDFGIPQGQRGETVTELDNLTLNSITTPSDDFPSLAVENNGSLLFGKIQKWFTSLRSTFLKNNATTTDSGYALDARMGVTLDTNSKTLVVTGSSISSSNMSSSTAFVISNTGITTDMVVVNSVLSNPAAMASDWNVSTDTAGQARITGTVVSGATTNITLYLERQRTS